MKTAILKYTSEQLRAITLLEEKPLSRDELLSHFPHKTKHQLAVLLRTPIETGKIVVQQGKFALYNPPQNMTVIRGTPQSYTAPPKLEFIYELGKFPKERH